VRQDVGQRGRVVPREQLADTVSRAPQVPQNVRSIGADERWLRTCSAPATIRKSLAVSRANVENAAPCALRHIPQ
jgi:hypothetical protein